MGRRYSAEAIHMSGLFLHGPDHHDSWIGPSDRLFQGYRARLLLVSSLTRPRLEPDYIWFQVGFNKQKPWFGSGFISLNWTRIIAVIWIDDKIRNILIP